MELTRRNTDSAILVPLRAVIRQNGTPYVFIDKDGKAKRVAVKLGESDGERVLLLDGPKNGARLITTGISELEPGQAIKTVSGS